MTVVPWPSAAVLLVDLMPRLLLKDLEPRSGSEVLQTSRRLADRCRRQGGTVAVVRTMRTGSIQPPGSGLARGTTTRGDLVVVKRTINAFADTGLDAELRARGVTTLVVAGVMTNSAIESTARTASELGFDVILIEDAMAALTAAEHLVSVTSVLPRFGQVVGSTTVLEPAPLDR